MNNVLYDALFTPHSSNSKAFLILKDGTEVSYQQLTELASRYASLLDSMQAKVGDRVAVQVEKSAQAIALYAGCLQKGCVFLPLNTAYTCLLYTSDAADE